MLSRVLEPEVMNSAEDAAEYDAMDHSAVNELFVTDLLAALADLPLQRQVPPRTYFNIIDLGSGTAQIPIELARRAPQLQIVAIDAAESMIAIARKNIAAAGLLSRIFTLLADAKSLNATNIGVLQFPRPMDAAISNSILHHIPEPYEVVATAIRVTETGGLLFHRDLARPRDQASLRQLVASYAGNATPYQRRLFEASLHAALTVDEMGDLVAGFGYDRDTVRMTSDRHWTWSALRK